jgi:hypothetical protein
MTCVVNSAQVHLIRGNHEASDINAQFGFRLECVERLGEQGLWVWQVRFPLPRGPRTFCKIIGVCFY